MEEEYVLDGKIYTASQLKQYARQSNLSLEEYIYESGATVKNPNKYVLDGKTYTDTQLKQYAKMSNLSLEDYLYESGATPVQKKKISSESTKYQEPQAGTTESPSEDGLSVTPLISNKEFSLTQEDLKDIGKKQPTDMSGKPLLPEVNAKLMKSIAERPKPLKKIEKQKSYMENIGTSLISGLNDVNKMIASIPETIYNLASIPQNAVAYVTGLDISTNADDYKKNMGITNPILDYYKEEGKKLEAETAKFNEQNYKSSSIYQNIEDGNYQDAFELLGTGIVRSAPTSIAIMTGGATMSAAELAAVSTAAFYDQNLEQLQGENPDASDIENNIKALGMSAAESVFSSIGQGQIGAVYRDIIRKEGVEVGQKVFKDGLIEMYKGALKKYGVPVGLMGEGIEESATQITQNMISGKPAFEGAADAFILGGGSGVMFTAPMSLKNANDRINNKVKEIEDKKQINLILEGSTDGLNKIFDVAKDSEINEKQLSIASLGKSRELLVKELDRGVKKGEITKDQAKQSLYVFDKTKQITGQLRDIDIDNKSKVKVANLLKERESLSQKIQGKDEALSVLEKQRIAEINEEIKQTILNPKETASEYIINEKKYSKEEFLKELEGKTPDELKTMKIVVNNDEQTAKNINEKFKTNAVQEQTTDESVLRTEQPEVGLQEMGEGDTKTKVVTEQGTQEVTPSETITTSQEVVGIPDEVSQPIELSVTPEVAPEQVSEEVNPLKDVESTTKALEGNLENMPLSFDYDAKNPFEVSEEYHKAKADGSNPELVKAVEELLAPKAEVTPETTAETAPVKPKAEVAPVENLETIAKSLEDKNPENLLGLIGPMYTINGEDVNKQMSIDIINMEINDLPGDISRTSDVRRKKQLSDRLEYLSKNKEKEISDFFNRLQESDNSTIKNASKNVAEAYQKAKENGKNPELVKAVEELLAPKVETVTETKAAPVEEIKVETAPIVETPVVDRVSELEKEKADILEKLNVYEKFPQPKAKLKAQKRLDEINKELKSISPKKENNADATNNFDDINRSENKSLGGETIEFSFEGSDGNIHKVKAVADDSNGYFGLIQIDESSISNFISEAKDYYKKLKQQKVDSKETDTETKDRLQKGIIKEIERELQKNENLYNQRNEDISVEYYESLSRALTRKEIDAEIATIPQKKDRLKKEYEDKKAELEKQLQEAKDKLGPKKEAPKTETKVETPKTETAESKNISKIDKEIAQLEGDVNYYEMKIVDIQEEIAIEQSNTKEGLVELKEKVKNELEEVKKDKSLSRDERIDKVEEIKYQIENFKEEQESIIESYKDDLKEAKSEYKKALSKIDKLLAKKRSISTETKAEVAPAEEVKGKLDELLGLDPADKTTLGKISSELGDMINEFKRIEKDLGSNILLVPMRYILQGIKALVDGGMTLQEAIKKVAADQNLKVRDVVKGINTINEIAKIAPAYNALMEKADALIARQKAKGIDEKKILSNLDTMIRKSPIYTDPNTTDAQRKIMEREARAKMGVAPKKAVSIGRVIGALNDIRNVSRAEKLKIISRIRELSKDAAKDLVEEIRELAKKGNITTTQAVNIISRFGKVNMLNEASVSNFVDYMTKVFADAEYDNKIKVAKGKLKNARKNINTKIGIANGLVGNLQKLFAINPELIPESYLERYLELVDMFGARQAVLTLEEKSKVAKDVIEILDEINNDRSAVEELSERFNYSNNQVIEDGKLNYAATVKNMLKEGEITEEEAALMTKYKSEIVPKVEKSSLSEQELQQEKDELLAEVKKSTINADDLPTRSERDAAKKIAALIKSPAVKELSNAQLKNLLKVIDNINNGYFAHSAQLIIEEINSNNNSKSLKSSVLRAVLLPLSKLYAQAKSILTRKDAVLEMIRRNPLFNIDQVLGDFKTKDVFNSLLEKAAEGEAKFTSELKAIQLKLANAEEKIAKSFTFKDKLNANKVLMSKFKMMTYMVQLEYNSNPDSKQVNPAAKFIEATINHIEQGKSQFGEKDAEMLQEILDKYTDDDGNIDVKELYNSFNSAEKAGIKTIQEINQSLKEKAEHTASVIRGQRINPLSNYIHLNVLSDTKPNDLTSGESFADQYNNSLRPSTKAKSLIERTGKVSPLNFDVFASAQKGAKFVLMDFHLTEPIRTARKTINKTIEALGKVDKDKRRIINAINNSFEEAVQNLVNNSYMETSVGDDVVNYISKQGYRSVLAGTGRFAAEFLSNAGFVIISDPTTFAEGLKHTSILMSPDAPSIMNNVNSKETNRIFPSDTLSGRLIDTNILSQASGIKGGKAKNEIINRVQQIWNRTGKRYKNAVELTADVLITTPDKAIMRPIWFGSFAANFKKQTGQDVEFKKIAANDETYMNENKEAIEKAKNAADERSVITGASNNAFTGILKGTSKSNQNKIISPFVAGFNNFNNFMTRFLIYEYTSARTGIYAAMGNGSLSRRQGIALLGAVTTRMTVYSLLSKALGSGLIGLLFGSDDDEEEEKKSLDKSIGQALTSTFTSLLFNRDFGNATKMIINEGVEKINENYLQELREGDYDPYEDALQYRVVPIEKKGRQTGVYDFVANMSGSYGPAIKTTNLIIKTYREEDKKEDDAIKRQEDVKNIRIPLEVLGNAGFIPLYKDIRKEVMKEIYKGLDKENNTRVMTREEYYKLFK